MIGDRLRQKRIINGMSLQDVANELSNRGRKLSRAILSKYELNQSTPNALVLRDLAAILGVKTDYFFSESDISINWQAFRKKASVTQVTQERIKILAGQKVERLLQVESVCGIEAESSDLPVFRTITTLDEAEAIAEKLRIRWKLDDLPIKSLSELLESKGIVLVPLPSEIAGMDGLVGSLAGDRKIIVYDLGKSVDRIRLTIAHELGHLVGGNEDYKLNEKIANRFAGAFLAPARMLYQDMGTSRTSFSIPELCLLKEKYGMSIQALTYRAKDLGILTESAFKSMFISFRSKGISTVEPGIWNYPEEPTQIKRYIFRAVAEGRISETKAQEIYPDYLEVKSEMEIVPESSIQAFLALTPDEREKQLLLASESIASFYEKGGALGEFDILDDVEEYE
ncbi:helix-turn-helix domain-containing protein [Treponema zuelzerae]|uniref:Helix-turn-helix domain-containing protein n=1 Tax=Teretinema zuelzerae TaxID=156 RepID=A0AAE3ELC6_9SPIR|nr:XRE family transcriptional regulator [Teretinema zuelzerae]MCD1655504.1 helix-turn-helix domain-containing protein [Teretinema zuelzerae]